LNVAGVGDLLSIHTACFDWEVAERAGKSEYPFHAEVLIETQYLNALGINLHPDGVHFRVRPLVIAAARIMARPAGPCDGGQPLLGNRSGRIIHNDPVASRRDARTSCLPAFAVQQCQQGLLTSALRPFSSFHPTMRTTESVT
jgi:hypothetical protein